MPPVLRFAPPIFQAVSSLSDVMRGRKLKRGKGTSVWGQLSDVGGLESKSQDWETSSQASDWEVSSSASSRGSRRSGLTFVATNLLYLESKDPDCVICVKKITHLGYSAAETLQKHFEQWGPVQEVLLSNVPVHGSSPEPQKGMRRRPAGMGWVVMETAEHAQQALAHGDVHTVQSASVRVIPFFRRLAIETEPTIEEECDEE